VMVQLCDSQVGDGEFWGPNLGGLDLIALPRRAQRWVKIIEVTKQTYV
jgi:hypothetical protein